jgi:5'-methylthioadenosine phosphorylase
VGSLGDRDDQRDGGPLAREAELCYATIALVTDYDVWHEEEEPVTVEVVVTRLKSNARTARTLIQRAVGRLPPAARARAAAPWRTRSSPTRPRSGPKRSSGSALWSDAI